MLFLKYLKLECVVIMTKLPQNFMWGGALAANQFEGGYDKGGKGLSVIDVMTSGAWQSTSDYRIYRPQSLLSKS